MEVFVTGVQERATQQQLTKVFHPILAELNIHDCTPKTARAHFSEDLKVSSHEWMHTYLDIEFPSSSMGVDDEFFFHHQAKEVRRLRSVTEKASLAATVF
jgi:hypothetical protein